MKPQPLSTLQVRMPAFTPLSSAAWACSASAEAPRAKAAAVTARAALGSMLRLLCVDPIDHFAISVLVIDGLLSVRSKTSWDSTQERESWHNQGKPRVH